MRLFRNERTTRPEPQTPTHIVSEPALANVAPTLPTFRPAPPSIKRPISRDTTIDLVHQAAAVVQSIKGDADQAAAHAADVARRATDLLQFAEGRIRSLESAHSAAEAGLREATARIDEMEQLASQSQAQIMFLERELSNAEHRARDAELKAMEAEEAVYSIQEAIRSELLGQHQPSKNGYAAAA